MMRTYSHLNSLIYFNNHLANLEELFQKQISIEKYLPMKHFFITDIIRINRFKLLCDSLSTNQKDLEKKTEKI